MFLQIAAVRESFAADFTLEWLLTNVGAQMSLQIVRNRESLVASVALE